MIDAVIAHEIQSHLDRIELDNAVRILYACESGSRAWGFASEDSDYDVRFIYVHAHDWYLAIDEARDVIELPVNSVLDIGGWELRKALRLMRKSNAVVFEWLQSPMVYRSDAVALDGLVQSMPEYFNLRAGAHHYLSMARNTFENDLQVERGEQVRIKRYFYALRPLFAVMWIVKFLTVPPMTFMQLRQVLPDTEVQQAIDALLLLKQQSTEKTMIAPVPLIDKMIARELSRCTELVQNLPTQDSSSATLNGLLRKVVCNA